MKGRLQPPALPQVKRILARQQALAHQSLGARQGAPLVEVCLMGDQNVSDVVGMAEQKKAVEPESKLGDVTAPAGEVSEEARSIAIEFEEMPQGAALVRV